MTDLKKFELSCEALTWNVPEDVLTFQTLDQVAPVEGTVGQDRAIDALKIGLELYAPGYNIYVAGLTGTGKMTTIKKILETIKPECKLPPDRCYVFNFKDPDRPLLLTLPRGVARKFMAEIDAFINHLKEAVPSLLRDEAFRKTKESLINKYSSEEKTELKQFEEKLTKEGFVLAQLSKTTPPQLDILVMVDSKPLTIDQLEDLVTKGELDRQTFEKTRQDHERFMMELAKIIEGSLTGLKTFTEELKKLERDSIRTIAKGDMNLLKGLVDDKKVHDWLSELEKDILDNLDLFKEEQPQEQPALLELIRPKILQDKSLVRYTINILHESQESCPIIIENNPTFTSLFGTIERSITSSGVVTTDFTKIKAGSLLRADGGYLILNALDVLSYPGLWHALKRVLKTSKLEIQPTDPPYQLATFAIKPEPIDINIKAILIGDSYIYDILTRFEEDFQKTFKIKAEFDTEMDNTKENLKEFFKVISRIAKDENLVPLDKNAVAELTRYAVRKVGRRDKISSRFSDIADIIREASYWSKKNNHKYVQSDDILMAIKKGKERMNLVEEKINEFIKKDILMIDVTGSKVGQVNGLSVYTMGQYSFGRPTRITASTSCGKSGIINIEREAGLSGRTHDKGVLILSGFIRSRYAQNIPLALSSSICFEQSYNEVDGDSASSTELYAILSSLSALPLKQNIAVTGSVNQQGEIQPVGGINEKIEGFYFTCELKGLTDDQGVMIPKKNEKDLLLDEEIIEAVRQGKFHIYTISTIEEGIEILTGARAGKIDSTGQYPADTVNHKVDQRLRAFAKALAEFEKTS